MRANCHRSIALVMTAFLLGHIMDGLLLSTPFSFVRRSVQRWLGWHLWLRQGNTPELLYVNATAEENDKGRHRHPKAADLLYCTSSTQSIMQG